MKTLCTLLFFLASIDLAAAELFTKLDGFAGLPFGSSIDQGKAAMDARGAVFDPKKSSSAHLEFSWGTFHNEPAAHWHLYYSDGKLYKGSVRIDPREHQHFTAFEELKKKIREKYGNPAFETVLDVNPDELYRMIRSGKAVLESVWQVGPSHSISCRLVKAGGDVIIRLTYQDDTQKAQLSKAQENDI